MLRIKIQDAPSTYAVPRAGQCRGLTEDKVQKIFLSLNSGFYLKMVHIGAKMTRPWCG